MSSILRVHVKGFFNMLWLAIYKTSFGSPRAWPGPLQTSKTEGSVIISDENNFEENICDRPSFVRLYAASNLKELSIAGNFL